MNSAAADMTGRVAIVTGASSGIGRAAAATLAGMGARVLATARDRGRLEALKAETGVEMIAVSLSDEDGPGRIAAAAAALGGASVLVHSAGRGGYLDRPIFDQSLQGWRETMRVNLEAAFELAQSVARTIRDGGWGRIVFVGSTAGEMGAPSMAPYCASKHGLVGLMRSVAHDVAPFGGTCNAVMPGWVRTEMAERDARQEAAGRGISADEVWRERDAANPSGRIVDVEEVAATIAFLAGPASSGVNGQAITVSRGSPW